MARSLWTVSIASCLSLAACADSSAPGSDDEIGSATGGETGEDTGSSETGDSSSTEESGDSSSTEESESESSTEESESESSESEETETETGETGFEGPLDDVLTLAHVQVKATHNSYHLEPLIPFDASHEYSHPPLDVQLEDYGVRAFELDLHRGTLDGEFLVYHIIIIDEETTCETFEDCLLTISDWSEQNPGHVPIMIWLELKDSTGGMPIDDLLLVDQAILDVFPPNRVLTPDFVRGDYDNVRAALEAEGWPTLGEVRGKVMFNVLNGGHPSVEAYTYGYTSLLGRMMFVGQGDYELPYAAVDKINDPGSPKIAEAHAADVLTASNVCGAGQPDGECFAELEAGKLSGTHALKDDFLAPVDGMRYFLDLPEGNPVRCNAATAPPECTAEAIEDLP